MMKLLLFLLIGLVGLPTQSPAQGFFSRATYWNALLTKCQWGTNPIAETCPQYTFHPNGSYEYSVDRAGDDPNAEVAPFYVKHSGKWSVTDDVLTLLMFHRETFTATPEETRETGRKPSKKVLKEDFTPPQKREIKLHLVKIVIPELNQRHSSLKLDGPQPFFRRFPKPGEYEQLSKK